MEELEQRLSVLAIREYADEHHYNISHISDEDILGWIEGILYQERHRAGRGIQYLELYLRFFHLETLTISYLGVRRAHSS